MRMVMLYIAIRNPKPAATIMWNFSAMFKNSSPGCAKKMERISIAIVEVNLSSNY